MYCPKCGAQNNHAGKFCQKCGQNLNSQNQRTVQQSTAQPAKIQPSNTSPAKKKTPTQRTIFGNIRISKKVELIAGIAGIIGCLFMSYTFFTGFNSISDLFGWSLKSKILGTWYENPSTTSWSFFDDGTFQVNSNIPVEGTFEFIDKNHLRIQVEGLFFFAGSKVWEANISETAMTLSSDTDIINFYRDKSLAGLPPDAPDYTSLYNVYIQNVVLGSAAEKLIGTNEYTRAKDGWQHCAFDIILENKTGMVLWGPNQIYGNLIDSGGYERKVQFETIGDSYYQNLLLPNVRIRIFGYAELPLSEQPASVELGLDGSIASFVLDAQQPRDDITVPFNEPPNDIPSATQGIMEYNKNGLFRVKLFNFRFMPNPYHPEDVTLEASSETENFGGYDLRAKDTSKLGFIMIDNNGKYYDNFSVGYFNDYVAPSMIKQKEDVLIFVLGTPHKDFDWVWIVLFDIDNMYPIAQATMTANDK